MAIIHVIYWQIHFGFITLFKWCYLVSRKSLEYIKGVILHQYNHLTGQILFVADSLSSKEKSVLMCLQKYNCFGLLWFLEAGGGNMEEIKGEMPYGAQGESQCEGVVFEKE